ncbi:hypothetical protein [Bacillus toyonensis]|uniref:hypothetical protein n=1 Tax=Bacillus toyonensis TaxID=155322 RepID=UPI001145917B|nr:hypothetical protein [Bacillus toyonensis]
MTAESYAVLCERLIAVAVAVSCLEYLVRPDFLGDGGLASWSVGRLSRSWKTGPWGGVLDAVLAPSRNRLQLLFRLVAAVVLVLPGDWPVPRTVALAIVVAGALLAQVRSSYGHDGADQMCLIVAGGLLVGRVFSAPEPALWFIACQAGLAYATAGLKKLASPVWRSGAALPGVMSTTIYGQERAYQLVAQRPWLARLGCFTVISFESAFPLALLGSPPLTLLLLGTGFCFHVSNALTMRLNTFFWAFVATSPAIVFVAFTW